MATYAIGDLQGCFRTFQRLLSRVGFDDARDRLWLAGDLVARGPGSLEVLRWASVRERVTAVLGNHDLRLLAAAEGLVPRRKVPTLLPILDAPDAPELLGWVRDLPLLHREGDDVLLHAGLLPRWSLADAEGWARRGEATLRGPEADRRRLLASLRPRRSAPWADLDAFGRLSLAVNTLTAVRVVDGDDLPDFEHSGPPSRCAPGSSPWFERSPVVGPHRVVCGHWAALGFHRRPGLLALDSGCVWGRSLTAVRLDDGAVFQEPNAEA